MKTHKRYPENKIPIFLYLWILCATSIKSTLVFHLFGSPIYIFDNILFLKVLSTFLRENSGIKAFLIKFFIMECLRFY